MSRLNNKAAKILQDEIKRIDGNNKTSFAVQSHNALQRVEILRKQPGTAATLEELCQNLVDLLPNFDEEVLRRAAKANRGGGLGKTLAAVALGGIGLAGLIWVVNLPYPMIRRPVAKVAPRN
jgi:hypothetical protein